MVNAVLVRGIAVTGSTGKHDVVRCMCRYPVGPSRSAPVTLRGRSCRTFNTRVADRSPRTRLASKYNLPHYQATKDWRALAWWIHENMPAYSELEFFAKNEVLAFNIGWREKSPRKTIYAWAPKRVCLTKPGMPGHAESHVADYAAWLADA